MQRPFQQIFPRPGWVEHNPQDILYSQLGSLTELLAKRGLTAEDIDSIGIDNQRETTIVWDPTTGQPVYNAIVWQCRRTADLVEQLCGTPEARQMLQEKTGLLPDAYFSASKIRWILDFGIPLSMMPEVRRSSGSFGETSYPGVPAGIPITGVAGDQQAALFGQCCFEPGQAKNTYGTGCFMLMHTGHEARASKSNLVTTIVASAPNVEGTEYALEGSVFVAGALIQWLRDQLGIVQNAADTEWMAKSVEDTGGVYIVPAFTGLGAPWWNPDARGAILGITRGTTRNHIARAALEALAYQIYDLADAMAKDAGHPLGVLNVDGGASANSFLMQFQADILGCELRRPENTETTSLGAAFLAGLATGYWSGTDELKALRETDNVFHRQMDPARVEKLVAGWHDAVHRVM